MDDHDHHHMHHHPAVSDPTNMSTTTILPNVTTMIVNALANASTLITATAPAMHHADGGHHEHHMTTSGPDDHISHDGHDGHDGHNDHNEHLGGMEGHMDMTFHFSVAEKILFKEWAVTTVGGMVGSVIGIFLIALLYEGLKFLREYLYREHFNAINYSSVAVMGNDGKTVTELHKVTKNRVFGWPHLLQTSLHVSQVLVSYFLMLIFMTYNVWLCLAVLLGSGLGYFFFGWKKATIVDISEHCH